MSIRIVNLRNYNLLPGEILIKVDRSTPVGNPFHMTSESQRDLFCDLYQEYFDNRVAFEREHLNTPGFDTSFLNYLTEIGKYCEDYDVALGCWCYPKRCHAETIKSYIESYLK